VLFFGHTACPYYASIFGAEYHRWFTHVYRIPNSNIVAFTAAATLARCLAQMRTISNVFESCGFTMNAAKFKYGKQNVFLGILIDSISMKVRFNPISAKSFRIELSLSAGMDRSKIHAIRCTLSSGLYLTSRIQHPYETASSSGLMTMKRQRMESTKKTAKTLLAVSY
jgi:hypothetical protein